MRLKTVEKPGNNTEAIEYFIEQDDQTYLSLTIPGDTDKTSELPRIYRAEWKPDIDEYGFEDVVTENLPVGEVLAENYVPEQFLDIETEGVRSGETSEDMYVEFPKVPYHDQNMPYHNLSYNKTEGNLSLEVRDTSVEPLEKWFQASKDINEEKADTIIKQVETLIEKHLEN